MVKGEIGPFFLIHHHIKGLHIDIEKGIRSDIFINHKKSHFEYFDELSHGRGEDYAHFPRGRVIYNIKEDKYLIYADKVILKENSLIKEIKIMYNLENEHVEILADEHYSHDYL